MATTVLTVHSQCSVSSFLQNTSIVSSFAFNLWHNIVFTVIYSLCKFNVFILSRPLRLETQALQRELSGLSERYSQKCLELNRAEQSNGEREKDITRKESELEQLRKENQVSQESGGVAGPVHLA